ncbi:alpha/beta-hydrolase [Aspergillus pseudotamarii]|uniref:Carboxylic ester hydrolase n=1 Tax=Aspergillus pseudotamarii TaxID=132259 RepID=A0A5N6T4R7_ASPPS|nr:alpha/beta-hydrolase [Aspergillus pseudotamarii]KAE8141280.1 alpha/beta-hydrolase [Aspergillus pseudotamarii]
MARQTNTEPLAQNVVVELPTFTTPRYTQKVTGKRSPLSDDLEEFRGIPYGEVTKRWEHARIRTCLPHNDFDATENGPICPQPSAARNSEYYQAYLAFPDVKECEFECLNLLIIRPSTEALSRVGTDRPSKLPVLVYIHGGAGTGAGSDPIYDPSRLVLRSLQIGSPIIAVNLTYRTGIFGSLGSTDILKAQDQSQVRGLNFGLFDQKVGITWVARNIAQFGGDPEQITLCGSSAGGSCVYAHLLDADAHMKKPLFRRAYIQSAPMLTILPMSLAEAEANWDKICQHWGIRPESKSQQKLESLRCISMADMLKSSVEINLFMLPPIADNVTMTQDTVSFPCVDSHQGPKSSDYKPIEVMIGTTDVESAGYAHSGVNLQNLQQGFTKALPTAEAGAHILAAYDLIEGLEQNSLVAALERFHSDAVFDLGIYRARNLLTAQRRAQYGNATSIQPYHVEFGSPFPGPKRGCAHHGVDVIYMFDAFHDALADADNRIFTSYAEGKAEAEHSATLGEKAIVQKPIITSQSSMGNNLDLTRRFQDHVIGFIAGESVPTVAEGEILVWGEDGFLRVEKLAETPRWLERIGRLEQLENYTSSILKVLSAI